MTEIISCPFCNHRFFRKLGVVSCSAVPPFMKCNNCEKTIPQKLTLKMVGYDGKHYRTPEGLFTAVPTCIECGKPATRHSTYETEDYLGNPMWIQYGTCPDHPLVNTTLLDDLV